MLKGIETAEIVKGLGGSREEVPKSLIAKQLNVADDSASLALQLSTAKAFGLIEGTKHLRLTELGKKYFYPTEPTEKQQAFLKLFVYPTVFEKLVDRFDGNKIPTTENLANLLLEMDVPESWVQRVASFFISTAKHVGVLEDDGFLRYGAAVHSARPVADVPSVVTSESAKNLTMNATPISIAVAGQNATLTRSSAVVNHDQGSMNIWVFGSKDSAVKLETSKELSKGVWEKLNQYVQILKPIEEINEVHPVNA